MGQRVMDLLRDAEVHVSSAAGTDIRFHNRGGEMGKFRMIAGPERIPIMLAGQVTWEPNEASHGGRAGRRRYPVAARGGRPDREPVRFEVSNGRITNIDGGREAVLLKRWLEMKGDPTLAPDRPCLAGLQSRYTGADGPHP
jgi:leucyl aminopeptidase (aminopeptidase T)